MRRLTLALAVLALTLVAPRARAQHLRDDITQLFIFGPGQDPLFLAGTADPSNPTNIQIHGSHFIPSANAANGSLIDFIGDAISSSVAGVPLGATSGSVTFRFEGGVPVQTSNSAGPIFGERAQTLGRGRVLLGVNYSAFHYKSLRGVPLDNLNLNFTHENVNFPGCDTIVGGDCSKMGIPAVENDIIQLRLNLDINTHVTAVYATYGVLDHLDVGVVLPLVSTSFQGESNATIVPFAGLPAVHFFGGTPQDPVLTAQRNTSGSAFGLGDMAIRVKYNVRETDRTSVAFMSDTRLPTGSQEDLLGSGSVQARGLAVLSSHFGNFSPHINVGYLYRGGHTQNDAVLGTVGFDHLMQPHVTLAVDLVSELQVGNSKLKLPAPVSYDAPIHRVILPTDVPDTRDDVFNGSFGFKFTQGGASIIANALVPLNEGGLRPGVSFTGGVEYTF